MYNLTNCKDRSDGANLNFLFLESYKQFVPTELVIKRLSLKANLKLLR